LSREIKLQHIVDNSSPQADQADAPHTVGADYPWLVLDAGGSKCAAMLVTPDGEVKNLVVIQARGPGGRHPEVVWKAVTLTLEGLPPAGIRLAAAGLPKPAVFLSSRLEEAGWKTACFISITESSAALALAGRSSGIVALAGTGAFVNVLRPGHKNIYLDGLGPVLGDIGGAHHIGRIAIRAVAFALQHPRYHTSLITPVFETLGIWHLGEFIDWSLTPSDRSVIASMARLVDQEARNGDAVARRILQQAAEGLATHVADMAESCQLAESHDCVVVATGSVLQRSTIYWDFWCAELKRRNPNLQPMICSDFPVLGVALDAIRTSGVDLTPALRQHIINSFRSLTPVIYTVGA